MNNYYKVYNLIVKSEIKLNELVKINESRKYDVIIKRGQVPRELIEKVICDKWFYLEKRYMVLKIRGVGNYYIKDGKEIIVEPYEGSDEHYIKTYLLGSAFGLLLKQRGNIAIHGGAVEISDKAIIITGNTGAGKSTLTNAFRENGCKFLCDDVSVLDNINENTINVLPAYPQQKLCKDAMEKMKYNIENFKKIDEGRNKFAIPVKNSFIEKPLRLGAIFELSLSDKNIVEISEVTGKDKIISILRNIYRIEIFGREFLDADYFKKCLNLANNIRIYKMTRPRGKFTVNDQIILIEDAMREKI